MAEPARIRAMFGRLTSSTWDPPLAQHLTVQEGINSTAMLALLSTDDQVHAVCQAMRKSTPPVHVPLAAELELDMVCFMARHYAERISRLVPWEDVDSAFLLPFRGQKASERASEDADALEAPSAER